MRKRAPERLARQTRRGGWDVAQNRAPSAHRRSACPRPLRMKSLLEEMAANPAKPRVPPGTDPMTERLVMAIRQLEPRSPTDLSEEELTALSGRGVDAVLYRQGPGTDGAPRPPKEGEAHFPAREAVVRTSG